VEHLHSGKIYGACLDVFENEKVESFTENEKAWYRALAQHPRVIMTPHIAGWTHESLQRIAELMLKRILESIV
jgi:D-3-phosphoglycerate dehydrogenase